VKALRIGRITASDRASAAVYDDASGPRIEECVNALFPESTRVWHRRLIPDEQSVIESALVELADKESCRLIITTGGTGPSMRDVTPEATRAVLEKELPGFGEIVRVKSFDSVPTSILSRATAGIRGSCLIVNLPGRPTAIAECFAILGVAIQKTVSILEKECGSTDDENTLA
jgi:molybdopterin adenylyltransferase